MTKLLTLYLIILTFKNILGLEIQCYENCHNTITPKNATCKYVEELFVYGFPKDITHVTECKNFDAFIDCNFKKYYCSYDYNYTNYKDCELYKLLKNHNPSLHKFTKKDYKSNRSFIQIYKCPTYLDRVLSGLSYNNYNRYLDWLKIPEFKETVYFETIVNKTELDTLELI